MLIDLRGKVGIVTGAGRGIGREIAATLTREGVTVVATDIVPEYVASLSEELERSAAPGMACLCDVRDSSQIQQLVDAAASRYGAIDLVVNNAGVAVNGPVETLSEETWDENLDTNLKGVLLMSRAVIPIMKRQRYGRIISAASFAAIVPSLGSAAYAASKAGVCLLTRVLAGELGPWNITVNCYAPGMIPTEMNHFADAAPERQERLLDTLTLRRWGEAADVANLVCFLASDLAGYITGTLIDVSGGKLATQIPALAYEAAGEPPG